MKPLTESELIKWRAAIEKCLKQKKYGAESDCELCRSNDDRCESCICNHYGFSVPDFVIRNGGWRISCGDLLNFFYGDCEFTTRHCRAILRRMLKWVDMQLGQGVVP